jgi:hypothetical protein
MREVIGDMCVPPEYEEQARRDAKIHLDVTEEEVDVLASDPCFSTTSMLLDLLNSHLLTFSPDAPEVEEAEDLDVSDLPEAQVMRYRTAMRASKALDLLQVYAAECCLGRQVEKTDAPEELIEAFETAQGGEVGE